MSSDNKDKRRILMQRGFALGNKTIDEYFEDISGDYDNWKITTISKEELLAEEDIKILGSKLFAKDSIQYGINNTSSYESWEKFKQLSNRCFVSPCELDPYIARLVIALNEVGIGTIMSCDGWHAAQDDNYHRIANLWMTGRYSTLWFWMICEFVFGEKWKRSNPRSVSGWLGKWEPYAPKRMVSSIEDRRMNRDDFDCCLMELKIPKGEERSNYKRMNLYAKHLEIHREMYVALKDKWVHEIEKLCEQTDTNVELLGFLKLQRMIYSILEEDFIKLRRTFETETQK